MSMRKTPKEILKGVEEGFNEEPWEDLVWDFNYANDEDENYALLALCAEFLEDKFPNETFNWQDFDILISNRLFGRWDSRAALAGQVLGEEVEEVKDAKEYISRKDQLDDLSEEEMVSQFLLRPGWNVMDAHDEKGGIVAFRDILHIGSVIRG